MKANKSIAKWAPFEALPAYLGGKRRLCRVLFSALEGVLPRARWRGSTFIDPFLGGGSVSLMAKAMGFRVICNDLALRSAAIGHGLIENGYERLSIADLAALLQTPARHYRKVAEERYTPSVFSKSHARCLDRALHNANHFSGYKRSLAQLLIVKWMLRVQPMSMLRGTDARAAFEGDLDRVSSRRLRHYMDSAKLLRPAAWIGLMQDVNKGVFAGRGESHQIDALAFLGEAAGDVVYLDPPYPGTTSYEREYAVIDDLLEGSAHETSRYSQSALSITELLAACTTVPVWVISLNNSALALPELEDLVRRHKTNISSIQVPFEHLGSIASEEKNELNREFIVVASN